MKIVFICGSLEYGKDGVGDYTRKLAGELIRQKHSTSIIALYDKFCSKTTNELQSDGQVEIKVLRIPFPTKADEATIKNFFFEFKPDWISIQYVPYSFDPKGLPFYLANQLKKITKGYSVHIMFHELWVGVNDNSSLKDRILKFFQKKVVKKLLSSINITCITTSNIIYQLELSEEKINAQILNLFSNIGYEKVDNINLSFIIPELSVAIKNDRSGYYFIGIFGSIYSPAKVLQALRELMSNVKQRGKIPFLILFGKNGKSLEALYTHFKMLQIEYISLGQLESKKVSYVLQLLDTAIAATPDDYLGKSGVYAAYKCHGLNVKKTGGELVLKYRVQTQIFNDWLEKQPSSFWEVKSVTKQFLSMLSF